MLEPLSISSLHPHPLSTPREKPSTMASHPVHPFKQAASTLASDPIISNVKHTAAPDGRHRLDIDLGFITSDLVERKAVLTLVCGASKPGEPLVLEPLRCSGYMESRIGPFIATFFAESNGKASLAGRLRAAAIETERFARCIANAEMRKKKCDRVLFRAHPDRVKFFLSYMTFTTEMVRIAGTEEEQAIWRKAVGMVLDDAERGIMDDFEQRVEAMVEKRLEEEEANPSVSEEIPWDEILFFEEVNAVQVLKDIETFLTPILVARPSQVIGYFADLSTDTSPLAWHTWSVMAETIELLMGETYPMAWDEFGETGDEQY